MVKWFAGKIVQFSQKIALTKKQLNHIAILDISRKQLTQLKQPRIIGYLLIILLIIPALLNLHVRLFPENEQLTYLNQEVLARPFNPQAHFKEGEYYLRENSKNKALQELKLAIKLGSIEATRTIEYAQKKKQTLEKEAAFWENQIKDKPGYRDAYIKLTSLNFQLQNIKQAKKYLKTAKLIDPNYKPVKILDNLLSN